MSLLLLAGLSVAVFGVSMGLARALADPRSPLYLLDHPNERSLHVEATPRGGGLAVLAAAGVALGAAAVLGALEVRWSAPAVAATAVAAISYLDDRRGVAARWRALVHLLAATWCVLSLPPLTELALPGTSVPLPAPIGTFCAVLFLVWMTNLYNFMDGMDGFAGGMGVVGFATLAVLGRGVPEFALVAAVLAAACAGFTVVNFPPARIFMGDVGASTLGFTAGALILMADRDALAPAWIGVLVFAPFVVDATVTLLRRALAGERVWQAHRTHFYQRLVGLGWSHRRTVLWEYALMLVTAAAALVAAQAPRGLQWSVAGSMVLTYTAAMVLVTRMEAGRSNA